MRTYRIRPVRPDRWVVERKRWWGWQHCGYDIRNSKTYCPTFESAQRKLDGWIQEELAANKHVAQEATIIRVEGLE